jgi:ribosomal protein S18 acetylase RimI-like enzyme
MSVSIRDSGPESPAAPEVSASSRLREVVPSDPQAVAWAASLHRELFRDIGPIARLGERLLRRFSYNVLIRDGLMKATVCEVDGQPAGLVAYTTDSKAVHAAATGRYRGLVLREMLLSLVLEPRIVARLPGAMQLLWERRGEKIEDRGSVAEMLAFGVLPEFRSPDFVRRTGLHVGDQLLSHALGYFKQAGFREARGVVLADNRPALIFFRMRASRIEPYPHAAKASYQIWFDVEKASSRRRS